MPDIGTISIGESLQSIEGEIHGSPVTMTEDGTVVSVTAAINGGSSHSLSCGIYNAGGDNVSVALVDSDGTGRDDVGSQAWMTFPMDEAAALSNGNSYLPVAWGSGGGGVQQIAFYNTANAPDGRKNTVSGVYSMGDPFPDPATFSYNSAIYSIYITYTASAAGITITPAAASISVAGQDVSLSAPIELSPSSGSISIIGQTVAAQFDKSLLPLNGDLSITGQTVTVLTLISIDPAAGTISIAGQDVSVSGLNEITPDPGFISIAGQDAELSVITILSPDSGSISIAGQTVNLDELRIIAPSSGTISINGESVTVDAVFVQVKKTGFIFKLTGKLVSNLMEELI